MNRFSWLFLAAFPFLTLTAFGQSSAPESPPPGNPAGSPAGTREAAPGVPAPGQANLADRAFLRAAALGGRAEVQFGKLASMKSSTEAVKGFSDRMVRDHTAANHRLAALAQSVAVPLPPEDLDPEHKLIRLRFDAESGTQFDKDYIDGQIADHQVTAQLLEYEIGSGQDAQLKGFASEQLPIVLEHLRMARDVSALLTTQGLASATQK
ncbi:MAG: DUF4142 domain-containing protein [Verrucomicrobia bacterium]|nr:DUF4142 domain-containing protein [Verrucomicrobiota bacterium]